MLDLLQAVRGATALRRSCVRPAALRPPSRRGLRVDARPSNHPVISPRLRRKPGASGATSLDATDRIVLQIRVLLSRATASLDRTPARTLQEALNSAKLASTHGWLHRLRGGAGRCRAGSRLHLLVERDSATIPLPYLVLALTFIDIAEMNSEEKTVPKPMMISVAANEANSG